MRFSQIEQYFAAVRVAFRIADRALEVLNTRC